MMCSFARELILCKLDDFCRSITKIELIHLPLPFGIRPPPIHSRDFNSCIVIDANKRCIGILLLSKCYMASKGAISVDFMACQSQLFSRQHYTSQLKFGTCGARIVPALATASGVDAAAAAIIGLAPAHNGDVGIRLMVWG
jgi:hypothetical protein